MRCDYLLFIGHAYFDLIIKALQIQSSNIDHAEQRLIGNCRHHGLVFHGDTPADGNCFFHAVSDQLSLLGVPDQSPSQLREKVVQFLKSNPTVEVSTVCYKPLKKSYFFLRGLGFAGLTHKDLGLGIRVICKKLTGAVLLYAFQ